MKAPGGKTARSWRHFALVGLCLALLYIFGLSSLKSHPATHEEWDSIKHLSTSQVGPINSLAETIESTIEKTPGKNHSPGFYILLNLWSRLTGQDLFTLRLLSVFTGLFALASTYQLARMAGGAETAMDAVLLATFIAFVTYYTYTVRMYALLATLSVWVAWSYWKVISMADAVPRRYWIAFILSSTAILWVHYFGTIALASVGMFHILVAPKNRRWIQTCLAATVAGLLFAPWLPIFLQGLLQGGAPGSETIKLTFVAAASAIASIYTNGLSFLVPVVGIVAVANFRRLERSQQYIFIFVSTMALLMLLGNEFAPLLIARRIRYTIILALPWACALAIGLNQIPRWRFLRIPVLLMWIAAYFAYSDTDELLLYTNWLTLRLHHVPHYQDLLYEPGIAIEKSDYIVSFHPDSEIVRSVHTYYDNFHGRWSGLIHIWTLSDGKAAVQTSNDLFRSIESMPFWRFRVWLIHNPEQTDLVKISAFTDGFLQFYRSCGVYVEKPQSVIALYVPKDVPCELLPSTTAPAKRIQYDQGSVLGNIIYEVDSDKLIVYLWWAEAKSDDYAYSLQIFDQDGAKTGPQTDKVISDFRFYREDLDLSALPAGEYGLKLVVYDARSFESQPGFDTRTQLRFERAVDVGSFTIRS